MKRLTTLTLIAVAAAAMVAIPLDAQTRGGSNSRSGSGGGNSRSSGGSRPSSSVSAPASQSRSSSQSGNTKGLGSVSRSSQPAQRSAAQPAASSQSRSSSSNSAATRSGSNVRSNNSSSASRQQAAPQRSEPARQQSSPASSNASQTRSRSSQPARSGSNVRSDNNTKAREGRAQQSRQRPNQPGGSINRNQPQPGMSTNDAPRTVRRREQAPRNFEGDRRNPSHVKMRPGPGHNMERIPPRRRDPMPFGRAVRFWDGGHHYFGYRVSYLPTRYVRKTYWGVTYYIVDGIYYRHYRGHYYVSRPPFGVVFDPVLDNLLYSVCNFAYYYDVYNTYRTINDNAKTIASQNATIAANNATIARQNEAIALNTERAAKSFKEADRLGLVQSYADAGMEYFYQDGVFFTKDNDGKYVTIVPPAGALVQELPDDYDVITLDGEEYYKVDDTIYKLTIIDGSPYFEVLGQLTGDLSQKYDLYDVL